MQFGAMLTRAREAAGLSQSELARSSGLDITTINRLERGKGARSRASTVQRLADGLGWAADDPRRDTLLRAADHDNRTKAPVRAWGRYGRTRGSTPRGITSRKVSDLLKHWPSPPATLPAATELALNVPTVPMESAPEIDARSLDMTAHVLHGVDDVRRAAIQLIAAAPALPVPHADEILQTMQAEDVLFPDETPWLGEWLAAVRQAVMQGWDVIVLSRYTADVDRFIYPFLGTSTTEDAPGQFRVRYFRDAGVVSPAYDVLLVPPVGALLFFSTSEGRFVDTAFFYPNDGTERYIAILDTLRGHLSLMREQTRRYITMFQAPSLEFDDELTRILERDGDVLARRTDVNPDLVPPALYDACVRHARSIPSRDAEHPDSDTLSMLRENYYRRREAARQQRGRYTIREICPKQAIQRLVRERTYDLHTWLPASTRYQATAAQVAEHLQAWIARLQDSPGYELGLVDRPEPSTSGAVEQHPHDTSLRLVKGEHAAVMRYHAGTGGVPEKAAVFTHPMFVTEEQDSLWEEWNALPPEAREKEQVIAWLREQLSLVQGGERHDHRQQDAVNGPAHEDTCDGAPASAS